MQVTVSRVSPVLVDLKISLPKEKVTRALAKAYNELGKNAQIRGFRRGKVPLPILKQFFGDRIAAEVSGKLVDETLPQALLDQKLEPVAQPRVETGGKLEGDRDWEYTAHLEVRPEVGEIVLDGITLERQVATIEDADVEHRIEHMREAHATLRTPEPARPVQKGDVVTLDYDVTIEGNRREDLGQQGRSTEVGTGKLLKEIDEGIVGMSVGEKKDITIHFADDHAREDLRGKDAVITVTVSEIREKVLPELDDEFAKDVGSETLEALRAKVRADMEREIKEFSESKLREDAVAALAEKNPIAVPPSLVENAAATIAREIARSLRMRNEPLDVEAVIKSAREQAEERVRAGLLLTELARRNNLTVTEADLNARMEELARETGKAVAKIRAEYRDEQKRNALVSAVLEDKVLELLLSKVEIKDVPAPKHTHEH